jgi:prepilin-type N-terminal cleavage/methylation domain-containing protein
MISAGKCSQQQGFSLVEMAVVLVIIGLAVAGLLAPISVQVEVQKYRDTQERLKTARESLKTFAMTQGRLPCPASSSSNGVESFCPASSGACGLPTTTFQAHGRCSNPYNGFLPAVTLGISPIDSQGYARDAWEVSDKNRIRYAVTDATLGGITHAYTAQNGLKTGGALGITPTSDLRICDTMTATTTVTSCGTAITLISDAAAIIYSVGKNAATGGTGTDELANPNPFSTDNDQQFISRESTASGATNGEFDDTLLWISPYELYGALVSAEQLP